MTEAGHDSLKTRRTLTVGDKEYDYFSLEAAAEAGLGDISRLPYSLKVLLENLLQTGVIEPKGPPLVDGFVQALSDDAVLLC